MKNILRFAAVAALFAVFPFVSISASADIHEEEMEALRNEIQTIKSEYEKRISEMEQKLSEMETQKSLSYTRTRDKAFPGKTVYGRELNPSIGVILNGRFAYFSAEDGGEVPGYTLGHEGERGPTGLALGETEFNFATSVDDKFFASVTSVLVPDGDELEVELEEAYTETLPGLGLPTGASIKMGKAFWTFGYLNEHHAHSDDFSDRALPYRVYMNKSYNDVGVQLSYVLPTDLYIETGGGMFRGDDFPFGGAEGTDINVFSAFLRVGSDIGDNASWRLGGYMLDGKAKGRGFAHGPEEGGEEGEENEEEHLGGLSASGPGGRVGDDGSEEEGEEGEEDFGELFAEGMFTGDTRLWATDLRFVWAPTGNSRQQEILFQAEYFNRQEKGTYMLTEDGETEEEYLNGGSQGWYAQGVYKFAPSWRVGARYSKLYVPKDSKLGYDPYTLAFMSDWANSEFARIRFQYNYEKMMRDEADHQILLHYVKSIGAHAAHKY